MASFRFVGDSPQIYNELYSVFLASDQDSNLYFAKLFSISNLQEYGLDEALEYNEEVLSEG